MCSISTVISMLCSLLVICLLLFFFFFNDTATTEIYTLSLHDALPISFEAGNELALLLFFENNLDGDPGLVDRKSTRLNSSHGYISYAVFCLKKKKKKNEDNSLKRVNTPYTLLSSTHAYDILLY